MQTICAVLALAAVLDLKLCSFDISNAFLNGDIDTEDYMEQPEGFEIGSRDKVCKLRKAINGTKQGMDAWKHKLQEILVNELSFSCIYSDLLMYVYCHDKDCVLLPIFVNQLVHRAHRRVAGAFVFTLQVVRLGPNCVPAWRCNLTQPCCWHALAVPAPVRRHACLLQHEQLQWHQHAHDAWLALEQL